MVEMEQQEGMEHWEFSIELAKYQHRQRRGFLLDHPEWVTSWNTNSAESLIVMDGVYYIAVDMYQFKLMTKDGLLARKPTGLVTNLWPIVKQMLKKRGSGDHPHQPLIGGRAQAAAQYNPPICPRSSSRTSTSSVCQQGAVLGVWPSSFGSSSASWRPS